ncbi:hypothetical protein RCL1_000900 [Eukaryota sp. TZLM3-RCL]
MGLNIVELVDLLVRFFNQVVYFLLSSRSLRVMTLIFILFYLLLFISNICHIFCDSIDIMVKKLNLSDAVAGATLYAIGSSAPELFVSMAALMEGESDMGLGTIVGSCAFNVLCCVGICCFYGKNRIVLNWKNLIRDAFCHLITAFVLFYVGRNGKADFSDSLVLLGAYLAYVILNVFNSKYVSLMDRLFSKKMKEQSPLLINTDPSLDLNFIINDEMEEIEKVKIEVVSKKNRFFKFLWKIFTFPQTAALYLTVPKCKVPKYKKFYMITFITCIVWMGFIEYFIVHFVAELGSLLEIPPQVMGIFVLGPATSSPELLASIYVVKQGKGDTVIGNAFGSNLFDVLFSLGIPYFIATAIWPRQPVIIAEPVLPSVTILVLISVLSLICFGISRFRMKKSTGLLFLFCYISYLSYVAFSH